MPKSPQLPERPKPFEPVKRWLALSMGSVGLIAALAFVLPLQWRNPSLRFLLVGVALLPLLIAGRWMLRARATSRFGRRSTLEGLIVGIAAPWRATRGLLVVMALALVTVALAGPQFGSRTRMLRKSGLDIVVALDFSKSMLARDVHPSRIARAKAELLRLFEDLGGDRVGMVAFAGETMEFPLTTDYAAVELFLRDLGPYDMPVGGTAIGRALVASQRLLERSRPRRSEEEEESDAQPRSQVVILLTDGEDHEGDPAEAAQGLAEAGIKLFTVGIGSRSGEPIPTYASDGTWTGYLRDDEGEVVHTALGEEGETTLRELAEATDGTFIRAQEGSVGIEAIREHLQTLHRSEDDARQITVHEDRFALVLLPAFLLLLLEGLLPDAWIRFRRRPPAPSPKGPKQGRGKPRTRRERSS